MVVSLLFKLLLKAVERVSESEKERDTGLRLPDEDKLCTLLEQMVDKQLLEGLFLSDGWLAEFVQEPRFDQRKMRGRRKSRVSSQAELSVDYLCSEKIGELLHLAVECCSKFTLLCVFKLAVARLFSGSRTLLMGSQFNKAVSKCVCACACACVCVCATVGK